MNKTEIAYIDFSFLCIVRRKKKLEKLKIQMNPEISADSTPYILYFIFDFFFYCVIKSAKLISHGSTDIIVE
jgi:hypothetical protein